MLTRRAFLGSTAAAVVAPAVPGVEAAPVMRMHQMLRPAVPTHMLYYSARSDARLTFPEGTEVHDCGNGRMRVAEPIYGDDPRPLMEVDGPRDTDWVVELAGFRLVEMIEC